MCKKVSHWKINALFETNGLRIVAMKMILIDKATAEKFYYVHKDRPFFNDLVGFMTSRPVTTQVRKVIMQCKKIGKLWVILTKQSRRWQTLEIYMATYCANSVHCWIHSRTLK